MAYDGTLQFDTRIDESGFDKGLGSMQGKATGAGDVMKGILGSNLLQAGLEKMVEVGRQGIQLASDLEEVQNVVDVTFGEGAAEIESFAKTASGAFGLTELQAKQFTGTVGAMVKSMGLTEKEALDMSKNLVGLTGDMASFYNLDHETAFEKIRSGIAGETEPLKALGINMSVANLEAYALSKGITQAYEKMSEAEKVQLRYGYIMQQTADAQGDFVRTQDSYANQVRVLQNNLDTLAGNVGAMLIPALTGAVGWLNDLFDGPGSNETQMAIDGAIASLSKLDEDISAIKNQYARDTIKIQIDYEQAGQLLADYKTLQEIGYDSATVAADMQNIAAQLMALYPELEQYIDPETGLLAAETEQVEELIKGYRDLALQKAIAAKAEAIQGQWVDAEVDMAILRQKEQEQSSALAALQEQQLQMQEAYAAVYEAFNSTPVMGTANTEESINAISQYISAFGGLNDQIMDELERYDTNIDALFENGLIKSVEEIESMDGGIEALQNLLFSLYNVGAADQNRLAEDIAAAQGAADAAQAAIDEFLPTVEQAQKDYETAKAAAENFAQQLSGAGAEAGEGLAEGAAQSVKENSDKVAAATKTVCDDAQRVANQNPVEIPVELAGYSGVMNRLLGHGHATGLDYVPYDNYLARLHVGEAVLPASEAREWRAGQQGFDYGALAAAIQGSNSQTGDSPLAFYIDGKELARAQADNNRIAMSEAGRRIAMGVGK